MSGTVTTLGDEFGRDHLLSPVFPLRKILTEVSEATGVSVADLVGRKRSVGIVLARQYAIWRAKKETGASAATIGRIFGNRPSDLVRKSIHRHEKMLRIVAAVKT